jgi:hypothetical protein
MNGKKEKKEILSCNCISVQTHWLYTEQFNQRGKPFYAICTF